MHLLILQVTTREIEDDLGIDVGIMSALIDNIPMRDNCDSSGIWAETTSITLRTHIFDCDLQIRGLGSNVGSLTNVSRFRCSGENAEILHNHLKQSK